MPGVKYFEVELKDDKIELKPLRVYVTDLEKIRSKMKNLGMHIFCGRFAWLLDRC
jgi:hypothetical protein